MNRKPFLMLGMVMMMSILCTFARGKIHEDALPPGSSINDDRGAEDMSFFNNNDSTINCIYSDPDVCTGEVVTYYAPLLVNHIYVWNASGGTFPPSTSNSFTVTWGAPGAGNVSLIIKTLQGDTVKICEWEITIHDLPHPAITASFMPGCEPIGGDPHNSKIDTSGCIRACDSSTVVYYAHSDPGSSFLWQVSGAISYFPGGDSVIVNWGTVGSGTVSVEVTSEFDCVGYAEVCVEIIESPHALFGTSPAAVNGIVEVCMLSPDTSQTIYFHDSSTAGNNTIINWYWDFGDGNTSILQNPSHFYEDPGTYDVWLVVENECHCKDSMMITVIVNEQFGPDISCHGTVCAGDEAIYSTSADCSVYNWTVTNGTIIGQTNPPYSITVLWDSTGPGEVTLQVGNCNPEFCDKPTTIVVPIITPTTTIDGPQIACEGEFSIYSVDNLPGCVFNWSISPPAAGTIVSGAGSSEITVFWPTGSTGGLLTVEYENPELHCSGSGELNISIGPKFAISGPTELCAPVSGMVYSGPGASYDWTVEDLSGNVLQSATGNSINVNWVTPTYPIGTYKVTAVDLTSSYCNSPQTILVDLLPGPPAPTNITGEDSVCPGNSYLYTSTPTNQNYYLYWEITGGTPTSATGNNITVTWGSSPPFSIDLYQVMVNSPNCTSAVYTLPVDTTSLTSPIITGVDSTCNNLVISYSAIPDNADFYEWSISPPTYGSIVSGQGTPFIDVQWNNAIGTATLSLFVKGCGDSASVSFDVELTAPPAPVIISGDSSCTDSIFLFSTPTVASNYNWNFGDGTSMSTTQMFALHTYVMPGNYNVTLTVTDPDGCIGTSYVTKQIIVHPSPTAWLSTPDKESYCTGETINTTMYINTQPGNTFEWYKNGAPLGVFTTSLNTSTPGAFYVVVTSPNGCTRMSNIISIRQRPCAPPCNIQPGSSIGYTTHGPLCNTVEFFGNISPNGTIMGWNFDDPPSGMNTSSLLNPVHTFTQAGYYNVVFRGKFPGNPDSCIMLDTQIVVIPAVADFEWEIIGCDSSGFIFDFFDKTNTVAPYTITSWSWTFAGGVPSADNSQNPSGVWLPPGSREVTLTITSSGGTTCVFKDTIEVPDLPVAFFTNDNPVCEGTPVIFTSSSTDSLETHLWDFGDMSSSALAPVTQRTYDMAGTYTVELTITDEYGCISTYSSPVDVLPNTLAVDVVANGTIPFCQGDSVELAADVSGGNPVYGYTWTITGDNTANTFAKQTGDYIVTVTDQLGCIRKSEPFPVVVNETPVATITGPLEYCVGEFIELSAFQGLSNTYEWFLNGAFHNSGAIFTYQTVSSTPSPLEVFVVVTGANGCIDTSGVVEIIIHPLPDPPSIMPFANICEGVPVTLTASNGQGLTDYVWNTGETGPSITVSQAGIYTVTVFNEFGCGREASVQVYELPDLTDLMTGCYEFCDSAGRLWIGPVGPGYTYKWRLGSTIVATTPNYFIPAGASGVYTLEISTPIGCTIISDPIVIDFVHCMECSQDGSYVNTVMCGDPEGMFGYQTYILEMEIFNPFGANASFWLSSPQGAIYDLTIAAMPASTFPGGGLHTVQGIFEDLPPLSMPGDTICIDGLIQDGEQQCSFTICFVLPECYQCEISANYSWVITAEDPCTVSFTDLTGAPAWFTIGGWFWDFDDGTTLGGVQHPTHTFPGNGIYHVCMNVNATAPGVVCPDQVCYDIEITDCDVVECDITPDFSWSNSDGQCELQFIDLSSSSGTIYDWDWNFGDGSPVVSGVQNPTHQFPGTGTYNVCLTVHAMNGSLECDTTICMWVEVDNNCPEPCHIFPDFVMAEYDPCTFQFVDMTVPPPGVTITNWYWDFDFAGPGGTSNLQNPAIVTFPYNGVFHVCLDVNGNNGMVNCFTTTFCLDVEANGCGGEGEGINDDTELHAWPNPSNGRYYLNVPMTDISRRNCRVMNTVGEDVSFELGVEDGQVFIELSTDQPGLYLLTLRKGESILRSTLIKY